MNAAHPQTQPHPSSSNAAVRQVATPIQRPQPTKKHPQTEMLPPPLPQKKILENEVTALSNCFRVHMRPFITPIPRTQRVCRMQWSARHRSTGFTTKPDVCKHAECNPATVEAHFPTPVVFTITRLGHRVRLLPLWVGRSKSLINSVMHWNRVWYEYFSSFF